MLVALNFAAVALVACRGDTVLEAEADDAAAADSVSIADGSAAGESGAAASDAASADTAWMKSAGGVVCGDLKGCGLCCGTSTSGYDCTTTCSATKMGRLCDEKADCVGPTAGQPCCAMLPSQGLPGSSACRPSCTAIQYCLTNDECPSKRCVLDDGPPPWPHGRCAS